MLSRSVFRASRAANLSSPLRSTRAAATPVLRASAAVPSRLGAARWYSEETKKENGDKKEGGEKSEIDACKEQLDAKGKEVLDLKDKYLRSVAEFRNLQERTKREVAAARDFAIQKFARDLVESVDNLDRALQTVPADAITAPDANKDLVALHDGLKMTDKILLDTLKKHGLERFDPSPALEKFDPNVHEAVFQTPMPDKEDGVCFHTQQKGFLLNGRVLRAAKVGVVKNA
ncbi:mitochondrial co-chaperone-like protein GrpE [Phyllosticta citribraziliensis]|uniref:GrpE protein homolog n=1 Tax=Phyllosticta citribraziliensis TaxID=989973 RepID=A0ABR1M9R6_9PEZI